jgi:hypothetical protein
MLMAPKTNPFSNGLTLKKKRTEIKMSNPQCFAIAKQMLTYSGSHVAQIEKVTVLNSQQ